MNKRIGPTFKHVWNDAMHTLYNFIGFVVNTTAYHLGWYSLHLLLLKSKKLRGSGNVIGVELLSRRWATRSTQYWLFTKRILKGSLQGNDPGFTEIGCNPTGLTRLCVDKDLCTYLALFDVAMQSTHSQSVCFGDAFGQRRINWTWISPFLSI